MAILGKIDSQEEIKSFYSYKDAIDTQKQYFTHLLSLIGKTYSKLLFFYCSQICISDMEFGEEEKSGLDELAFLLDLDKRQRLTIKQLATEMKLAEVEGMFIAVVEN